MLIHNVFYDINTLIASFCITYSTKNNRTMQYRQNYNINKDKKLVYLNNLDINILL